MNGPNILITFFLINKNPINLKKQTIKIFKRFLFSLFPNQKLYDLNFILPNF